MKKIELISPAGNWASLNSAVSAGADAVYFGVKGFNMRRSARNFDVLELKKIMAALHSAGKRGYLTLNVTVRQNELDMAERIISEAVSAGVDAVVLWDMAVLGLAKKYGIKAHISTQASVSNLEALKAYYSLGVKRFVLARECSLEDIKTISDKALELGMDISLESFVHGAMCVSVSGRCFLSQHTFSRSANRGDCLQPCRREYKVIDTDDGECEYVMGSDYVMSARDLCSIQFLDELMRAGITCFKIEGRMRPPEYVSVVTKVYRKAIDALISGNFDPALSEKLLKELSGTFNRGFTKGFYFGRPDDIGASPGRKYEKEYLGRVTNFYSKINVAEIKITRRGIKKGDKILISGDSTPAFFFEADQMQIDHAAVEHIEIGGSAGIKVPSRVRRNDKVFLWTDEEMKVDKDKT